MNNTAIYTRLSTIFLQHTFRTITFFVRKIFSSFSILQTSRFQMKIHWILEIVRYILRKRKISSLWNITLEGRKHFIVFMQCGELAVFNVLMFNASVNVYISVKFSTFPVVDYTHFMGKRVSFTMSILW